MSLFFESTSTEMRKFLCAKMGKKSGRWALKGSKKGWGYPHPFFEPFNAQRPDAQLRRVHIF